MSLCIVIIAQAKITEPIDKIFIEKSKRTMTLFSKGKKLKTYNVAFGFCPVGHKVKEGDGKTPEGIFKMIGNLGV